jgi:hypothetical protein
MPTFRSLNGAVLSVQEVVALTSEGSRVQLEPLPGGETLVILVPEHTVAVVDRGSSTFRIKPISPIHRPPTDLTASAAATEKFRLRNARMRRCLRIGFKAVEAGDDVLQPIDFQDR